MRLLCGPIIFILKLQAGESLIDHTQVIHVDRRPEKCVFDRPNQQWGVQVTRWHSLCVETIPFEGLEKTAGSHYFYAAQVAF